MLSRSELLAAIPQRQIWLVDFEFQSGPGERPIPICLVAHELRSKATIKLWKEDFGPTPPYPTSEDSLFIAFYASAELGCHAALGWEMPRRILDLFVEFRAYTNGLPVPAGNSLLAALSYFGLEGIAAQEKKEMQALAIRGGPWTEEEKRDLLDYCQTDVVAMAKLLAALLPHLTHNALLRGRYMAAAARIEFVGIPIDVPLLDRLNDNWDNIKIRLITDMDKDYHVYDGLTFRQDRFEQWLIRNDIAWPRTASGRLSTDDDTFDKLADLYPQVKPLQQLKSLLEKLKLRDLTVGTDGYNRCLLSTFRARTGRNQPSNSKFVFGVSSWLRGLIKPHEGYGLAYIDWEQQEFGIAAALSGDQKMLEAYRSGDPYLAFAIESRQVPPTATKHSHSTERERSKQCLLGVQYTMGPETLAIRINQATIVARRLLRLHRELYSQYWKWIENRLNHAMLDLRIDTVFGWTQKIGEDTNPRSIVNFPMQSNGAEMLRIACCLATEAGIEVCAPVHDAILIQVPLDRLDSDIARMQAIMEEASRIVLKGFALRTEAAIFRYPDRYIDKKGKEMWERILSYL